VNRAAQRVLYFVFVGSERSPSIAVPDLRQLGFRNFFFQFVLMMACLFLLSGCGGKTGNISEAERQTPTAAGTPDTRSERRIAAVNDAAADRWTGDLDGMIELKIRALVVYSRSAFFYDKGQPRGISCEALRELETIVNKKFKAENRPVQVTFLPTSPKTWSERWRKAVAI
jgi:hypothetical protein